MSRSTGNKPLPYQGDGLPILKAHVQDRPLVGHTPPKCCYPQGTSLKTVLGITCFTATPAVHHSPQSTYREKPCLPRDTPTPKYREIYLIHPSISALGLVYMHISVTDALASSIHVRKQNRVSNHCSSDQEATGGGQEGSCGRQRLSPASEPALPRDAEGHPLPAEGAVCSGLRRASHWGPARLSGSLVREEHG